MSAADAVAAVERGDPARALDLALAAWSASQDPVVGDVIAALDVPVDHKEPRTKDAFHALWMDVAKRPGPADVGWLARTLGTKVPVVELEMFAWGEQMVRRKYAPLHDRIRALVALPPDPRIADGLCDLLEKASFTVVSEMDGEALYGPVLDALIAVGDPRSARRLQALVDRPCAKQAGTRAYLTRACAEHVGRLPEGGRAPDQDVWATLVPRVASDIDVDGLVAAVRADPDDLGVRRILADALTEQGDPRGEHIALQLAGDGSSKRANALLKAHRAAWLGPDLECTLIQVRFANGFPEEAETAGNARADAETWERASLDPGLATLRALWRGRGNNRNYAAFVTSPCATGLRVVELHSPSFVGPFAEARGAGLTGVVFPNLPTLGTLKRVASELPGVDDLGLSTNAADIPEVFARLRRAGWIGRLRGLSVHTMGLAGDSLFAHAVPLGLQRITYGTRNAALERVVVGDEVRGRASGWMVYQASTLVPHLPEGSVLELVDLPDAGPRQPLRGTVRAFQPFLEAVEQACAARGIRIVQP